MSDWQDDAACKGWQGEFFFAPDHETPKAKTVRIAKAKAICKTCPVVDECLAYAERHDEKIGIWGGLTEIERGQRPKPPKRAGIDFHGTAWGARVHRSNGEDPCDECQAAFNEYHRNYKRERSLPPGDPRHGSITGYRNFSCRCPECREAQRLKLAAHRALNKRKKVS